MFTQRNWTVWHHKDGSHVQLQEYGFKARAWSLALEICEVFDSPGHWACSPREWEFKIPLGRPQYTEDGWLENSLGGWHYERASQFLIWMMNHEEKNAKDIAKLPIDEEMFKQLWPEMAFLVEDDDDDED